MKLLSCRMRCWQFVNLYLLSTVLFNLITYLSRPPVYFIFNNDLLWLKISSLLNTYEFNFYFFFILILINCFVYNSFIIFTSLLFNSLSLFCILDNNIIPTLAFYDGLLTTHPFFFYNSLVFYLSFIAAHLILNTPAPINALLNLFYLFIFISISLLTGGFWSCSQSLWGYWWTWDPVEFVIILLLIGCLLFMHNNQIFIVPTNTLFLPWLSMCILLYVRVGFIQSRHSFFSKIPEISLYITYFILVTTSLVVKLVYIHRPFYSYILSVLLITLFSISLFYNLSATSLLLSYIFICILFYYTAYINLFKKTRCIYYHILFLFILTPSILYYLPFGYTNSNLYIINNALSPTINTFNTLDYSVYSFYDTLIQKKKQPAISDFSFIKAGNTYLNIYNIYDLFDYRSLSIESIEFLRTFYTKKPPISTHFYKNVSSVVFINFFLVWDFVTFVIFYCYLSLLFLVTL